MFGWNRGRRNLKAVLEIIISSSRLNIDPRKDLELGVWEAYSEERMDSWRRRPCWL